MLKNVCDFCIQSRVDANFSLNRKMFVVCFVFVELFSWYFSRDQFTLHKVSNEIVQTEKTIQFCFTRKAMANGRCIETSQIRIPNESSWTRTRCSFGFLAEKFRRLIEWRRQYQSCVMYRIVSYRCLFPKSYCLATIRPSIRIQLPILTNKTEICVLFHPMRFNHKSLINSIRVWYISKERHPPQEICHINLNG